MTHVKIKGADFNEANKAKAREDARGKILTPAELIANYKRAGWVRGPGGAWLPPIIAPFNLGGFDISKIEIDGIGVKDNLRNALTAAKANFTIEGASTVVLSVEDPARELIKSGFGAPKNKSILDLDGFKYRFVKIAKRQNNFELVFEDELINKLRRRGAHRGESKRWERGKYTRAQVIFDLVREVTAPHNIFIPEIFKQNPIAPPEAKAPTVRNKEKHTGFGPGVKFNVKEESKANGAQITAAQEMLEEGVSQGIDHKGLVMGIMAAIQESNLNTEFNHNPGSEGVGILSQIKADGWPATGNVKTDSREFFKRLKVVLTSGTHYKSYGEAINAVQGSADASLYNPWKENAEKIVELFQGSGNLPSTLSSKVTAQVPRPYFFERKNEEDSWTCIQRLASEIQWRAFVVRNTFYFISEEALIKSGPIREVSEFPENNGIDWIDYEKDEGQAFQSGKVVCRANAWDILPGSMIEVTDEGPSEGTWLVYSVEVDLFKITAEITINAPLASLPEPAPQYETITRGETPSGTSNENASSAAGAAERALTEKAKYKYAEIRPMPSSLFGHEPRVMDCSTFVTLCYKAAGLPDPNHLGYNGEGFTGTLIAHCHKVSTPQPGDLCFYLGGGSAGAPQHVTIYVGHGKVISMGGEGDPDEGPAASTGPSGFMGYYRPN
jgi:cell wall-associated NlpC family hydrolase